VPYGDSNLLWDCVTLLDDATAAEVERRGGIAAIACALATWRIVRLDPSVILRRL